MPIPKTESNIAETMYVGKTKVMICTDSIRPKAEQEAILEELNQIATEIWHSLTPEQQIAWNKEES